MGKFTNLKAGGSIPSEFAETRHAIEELIPLFKTDVFFCSHSFFINFFVLYILFLLFIFNFG